MVQKPLEYYLRQGGIRLLVAAERKLAAVSDGKLTPRYTPSSLELPKLESRVKVIKRTESEVFIEKLDDSGKISHDDFVILATSDLHFEDDLAERQKIYQMLAWQIADIKPDLVVFTGDVIESDHQQLDAVRFAHMMENIGVYWAFCFGNHEAREEKEFHKYFLLKNKALFPHCLTIQGPDELFGYGNYFINIMENAEKIKHTLVFMDSGRDITDKYRFEDGLLSNLRGYDYLKRNQKKWYSEHITALKKKYGDFTSSLFIHIPLKEYEVVNTLTEDGYVPTGKAKIFYGRQYESVGSSPVNSGMFDLMKKLGSTKHVFCGHDHINDFYAEYDGITLCYLQAGSYDSEYNLENKFGIPESEWQQGATEIRINGGGELAVSQHFNSKFIDRYRDKIKK